ncbi:MAG: transcriptional regulator NrdR [Clostridiales bacterium]|nr:transcriptional regulator NrdR [Clostridiales bacterium]MDY5348904.1 transcriptional regulator NrdR [Candidatus Ventricola sp.]MDY5515523.1 transcriptional regulator NrdR [Candidatus Ventricola sp.]
MKCIYCNCTESRVVDSRPTEDGAIRRRRECERCQRRFTTYEKIEMLPVLVIKKDKRREPFDASKVRNGIIKACEKRPVALSEIEKLVNRIEASVCSQPEQEVTSERIGELVMDGLKTLDEVAYIRFASVYRQFKDVQSFMAELQQLLDSQKKPEETGA